MHDEILLNIDKVVASTARRIWIRERTLRFDVVIVNVITRGWLIICLPQLRLCSSLHSGVAIPHVAQ
jgi:hypothetical protein